MVTMLNGMPSPTASKSGWSGEPAPMALIIAAELEATASPFTGRFHTFEDGKT